MLRLFAAVTNSSAARTGRSASSPYVRLRIPEKHQHREAHAGPRDKLTQVLRVHTCRQRADQVGETCRALPADLSAPVVQRTARCHAARSCACDTRVRQASSARPAARIGCTPRLSRSLREWRSAKSADWVSGDEARVGFSLWESSRADIARKNFRRCPSDCNSDLFQILIGQVVEDGEINIILGKRCAHCSRLNWQSQFAICLTAAKSPNHLSSR